MIPFPVGSWAQVAVFSRDGKLSCSFEGMFYKSPSGTAAVGRASAVSEWNEPATLTVESISGAALEPHYAADCAPRRSRQTLAPSPRPR